MSGEITGKDVVVDKVYKSPKGTIIKILGKRQNNGKTEITAITTNKSTVNVPEDIILTEVQDTSGLVFDETKEKKIKKEEKKMEKKSEVESKPKAEAKSEAKENPKVAKEKKGVKRSEIFEKVKGHIKANFEGYKENKNNIVFVANGKKLRLFKDARLLSREDLNGKLERKYKDDYVYKIEENYNLINFKD